MIRNETENLFKYVKLYRKYINTNGTYILRSITSTALKLSCTNLYSVDRYDETNMKVFALSLWGKCLAAD